MLLCVLCIIGPIAAQTASPELETESSSTRSVDYSQLQIPEDTAEAETPLPRDVGYSPDPNDHRLRVGFLGNTLISRDSEFGYLETELTRRQPERDIVFRNLGWAGDTVTGDARIGFGRGEENVGTWRRPEGDNTVLI